MKKAIKIILVTAASIVAAVAVAAICIWNGEIRSICSIEPTDQDPYLYTMEYKAPYDLDKVLEADLDSNRKLVEFVIGSLSRGLYKPDMAGKVGNGFACTSFQAANAQGDGYLFGRNYDFFKNPSMVLTSRPKKGYASISTCDLSHVGYTLEKLPDSFASKALCLAMIYTPMDGMNEKGLCVSILALPHQAANQQTGKHVAGTSIIMRLLLDRCATLDEALDLIGSVDIRHDQSVGNGYHYFVCDAAGKAAVVEFDPQDGWKTMIVGKPQDKEYLLVTNHLIAPKYYTSEPDSRRGNVHSLSWERYAKAGEYLEAHSGVLSPDEALECLSMVHWKDFVWDNGMVEDTQWSGLYDESELSLKLRHWNSYEQKAIEFKL